MMSEDQVEGKDIFNPGEMFRGYEIERLLGKGGVGAVYLVRHTLLDTLYALKVLYPEVAQRDENYVKRFLREAKLASRVRHPNLVGVHDCGFDDERQLYYLVMDYVDGSSLRTAVGMSGPMPIGEAARIIRDVASALEAAQRFHVVHRDIKPENIMVQTNGTTKLVDLGIAKADNLGDSLMTMTHTVFGTPVYVSPEQAVNSSDVDQRADIYSLGIVFFEMLVGRPPYDSKNVAEVLRHVLSPDPTPDVREFNPEVPAAVAELVAHMCMKDREQRLPDFTQLLAELDNLGVGESAPAPDAEYAMSAEDAAIVEAPLPIDMENLPTNNPTLTFETQDEEIRSFVENLKRRKRKGFFARLFGRKD